MCANVVVVRCECVVFSLSPYMWICPKRFPTVSERYALVQVLCRLVCCWGGVVGGGVGFGAVFSSALPLLFVPCLLLVGLRPLAGGVPSVALWGFCVPRLLGCWLPGCLSPFLAVCFFPFVYVFIIPYNCGIINFFWVFFGLVCRCASVAALPLREPRVIYLFATLTPTHHPKQLSDRLFLRTYII